jgi:hypothetical protein
MRINKFKLSNNRARGVMKFITSIVFVVVGFLLFQPFFWVVLVFGDNFHYVTLPILFMIIGCIIGLPMFFMGLISLTVRKSGASISSYNDHDLSRIRHKIEQDSRR